MRRPPHAGFGNAILHVPTQAERAAWEMLVQGTSVSITAMLPEVSHSAGLELALPQEGERAREVAEVMRPLGSALISSVTERPGAKAKLKLAARQAEAALAYAARESGADPLDAAGGRATVEELLADLLKETALEEHDILLFHIRDHSGTQAFVWELLARQAADAHLVAALMQKMLWMLEIDPYLCCERRAAQWWYSRSTREWPEGVGRQAAEDRANEWLLADRIFPSLGETAATAFLRTDEFGRLAGRKQKLARAFASSVSGLFEMVDATRRGIIAADVLAGTRYEVLVDASERTRQPGLRMYFMGRLVPNDGRTFIKSLPTIRLGSPKGLPEHVVRELRAIRDDRPRLMPTVESVGCLLSGETPQVDRLPDLDPHEASDVLHAFLEAREARMAGEGFGVEVPATVPIDEVVAEWLAALRKMASGAK